VAGGGAGYGDVLGGLITDSSRDIDQPLRLLDLNQTHA